MSDHEASATGEQGEVVPPADADAAPEGDAAPEAEQAHSAAGSDAVAAASEHHDEARGGEGNVEASSADSPGVALEAATHDDHDSIHNAGSVHNEGSVHNDGSVHNGDDASAPVATSEHADDSDDLAGLDADALRALVRHERGEAAAQLDAEARTRAEVEDMCLRIEKHFKAEKARFQLFDLGDLCVC